MNVYNLQNSRNNGISVSLSPREKDCYKFLIFQICVGNIVMYHFYDFIYALLIYTVIRF